MFGGAILTPVCGLQADAETQRYVRTFFEGEMRDLASYGSWAWVLGSGCPFVSFLSKFAA